MPISYGAALPEFMARLVGWDNPAAADLALRSLELAAEHRAELVLCGKGDMVPIAQALHRRTLGADRPFVVCDPRRGTMAASVRSPANYTSGVAALEAASGGTLCLRTRRVPRDRPALVAWLRGARDVVLVVCAPDAADTDPLVIRPAPIRLSPLVGRATEIDRVIAEYAADAIAELGAPPGSFTESDHAWVREHAATSLAEIEKATLRLVALRTSRNMTDAAARLGMAPVSLGRWAGRRKLHRVLAATGRSPCRST